MHVDNIASFTNCDPPRPWEGPLRHLTDDYDLKQLKAACDTALNRHNILVTWCHVKAHQDDKKNRKKDENGEILPLSQAALLNIDYDRRADAVYESPYEDFRPRAEIIVPEQARAVFVSGGITNTSKLKKQIMRDRHGPPLRAYILRKTKWTEAQFQTVECPHTRKRCKVKPRHSKYH